MGESDHFFVGFFDIFFYPQVLLFPSRLLLRVVTPREGGRVDGWVRPQAEKILKDVFEGFFDPYV